MKNDLDKVLLNFDEPFADSSALPTYIISSIASKHVKVVLTGDGGDEVFGGYNKYFIGKLNKLYTGFIPERVHNLFSKSIYNPFYNKSDERGLKYKLNKLVNSIDYHNDFYFNIISLGFLKHELADLIKPNYLIANTLDYYKEGEIKTLKDFRNMDKVLSLEGDLLVKVDRTSMMNSIECRSPFLNKKIWDFTNNIDDSYLINGWDKKYLLKEAFKGHFPSGFLNKSKQGFTVPVGDWLKSLLKEELLLYCNEKTINEQGIFHYQYLSRIIERHLDGIEDNTFRVWTFFCFQKWYFNVSGV